MSPSAAPQRTLRAPGRIAGTGLHTGKPCVVSFRPAAPGSGIRFFRGGRMVARVGEELPSEADDAFLRCSSVGREGERVLTVEHLLACLNGFGLTNLEVEVEGPELPALDGSALPYAELFRRLGIDDQEPRVEFYRITEPIFCYDNRKSIAIYPAEEFSVSYVLDYEHPHLVDQKVDFTLSPETFERQIAPSRTFCTEKEATELPKQGFGLGADAGNTLIIREDGSHKAGLRFPDECARHKVLDLIGDLTLLGFPVLGRVVGLRSGHTLNRRLVRAIRAQRGGKVPLERDDIKKILPHREPFLLVDRILEISEKHIIGVLRLTGKEEFFKGHFPQRPVMPGVLMIEALAQTGGVLMLSQRENQGKIAYLASVNDARFRRVVVPGEELRLEVEVLRLKSRIGLIKGVAKVGSEVACQAEILFSLAD